MALHTCQRENAIHRERKSACVCVHVFQTGEGPAGIDELEKLRIIDPGVPHIVHFERFRCNQDATAVDMLAGKLVPPRRKRTSVSNRQ